MESFRKIKQQEAQQPRGTAQKLGIGTSEKDTHSANKQLQDQLKHTTTTTTITDPTTSSFRELSNSTAAVRMQEVLEGAVDWSDVSAVQAGNQTVC